MLWSARGWRAPPCWWSVVWKGVGVLEFPEEDGPCPFAHRGVFIVLGLVLRHLKSSVLDSANAGVAVASDADADETRASINTKENKCSLDRLSHS